MYCGESREIYSPKYIFEKLQIFLCEIYTLLEAVVAARYIEFLKIHCGIVLLWICGSRTKIVFLVPVREGIHANLLSLRATRNSYAINATVGRMDECFWKYVTEHLFLTTRNKNYIKKKTKISTQKYENVMQTWALCVKCTYICTQTLLIRIMLIEVTTYCAKSRN